MPLLDNAVQTVIYGVGGSVGLKWVIDFIREVRADRRGEKSESIALKNLKGELDRLVKRVEELERAVTEKEGEIQKLEAALDEQRTLRRKAEDELDGERRARRALEERVSHLERKS